MALLLLFSKGSTGRGKCFLLQAYRTPEQNSQGQTLCELIRWGRTPDELNIYFLKALCKAVFKATSLRADERVNVLSCPLDGSWKMFPPTNKQPESMYNSVSVKALATITHTHLLSKTTNRKTPNVTTQLSCTVWIFLGIAVFLISLLSSQEDLCVSKWAYML